MKAIYLGRFQPLHIGHKKVIEDYRDKFDDFTVVVGSAEKSRTDDNPLTAEEREEIIKECFPNIEIIYKDDHESDEQWSKELEEKVDAEVVISQNDLVKQLVNNYTGMEIDEQNLYDPEIYSGSEIRRRIKSDEEWRYLVPKCAKGRIEDFVEVIKKSGTQYEFEPGWKKKNAYNDTTNE